MAYEKQIFEDGQVLFAEHLNYMEDGIEQLGKAPSIFVAVYGESSSAEIEAAYQAGKEILLRQASFVARLFSRASPTSHSFATTAFASANVIRTYIYQCNSDKWSYSQLGAEQAAYKVTSIGESSTDIQYPSAKAVYEYVKNSNTGVDFTTDATLSLSSEGVLSVNTAAAVEADNTLPVTSAAVHTTVGNIEVLLKTI